MIIAKTNRKSSPGLGLESGFFLCAFTRIAQDLPGKDTRSSRPSCFPRQDQFKLNCSWQIFIKQRLKTSDDGDAQGPMGGHFGCCVFTHSRSSGVALPCTGFHSKPLKQGAKWEWELCGCLCFDMEPWRFNKLFLCWDGLWYSVVWYFCVFS